MHLLFVFVSWCVSWCARSTFRKGSHPHRSLSVNVYPRKQGAEIVDGPHLPVVFLRNFTVRDAFDDDAKHLVVRKLTTLAIADLADKSPKIHGKVPIFNQLPHEVRKFRARSDLHTVHGADRSKFSNVPVEAFGLLQ